MFDAVGHVAEIDVFGVDLFEIFCGVVFVVVCLVGEGEFVPQAVILGDRKVGALREFLVHEPHARAERRVHRRDVEQARAQPLELAAEGGDGSLRALLIDESYNANPTSMRATLAQLAVTRAKRRIVVLGAMKELGEHGPAYHAALIDPLLASGANHAVLVGAEMQPLADELGKARTTVLGTTPSFAHCETAAEAQLALKAYGVEGGDAILVKGSNSVGLGTLVAALTQHKD